MGNAYQLRVVTSINQQGLKNMKHLKQISAPKKEDMTLFIDSTKVRAKVRAPQMMQRASYFASGKRYNRKDGKRVD